MLPVQEFLATRSPADLAAEHGVYARRSTRDPRVFTLNYDQIEVRDADPLSWECRGTVLRAAAEFADTAPVGETAILARPFARFFNHGQGACAPVDFDHPDTRFYTKVDGTLCIVYHDPHDGEWHVGTRSVPDADVPLDGYGLTFRGLFESALRDTNGQAWDDWTGALDRGFTYMFEVTAPENQVVVYYERRGLTLLGIRDTETGAEADPHGAWVGDVPACPHWPGTRAELMGYILAQEPHKFEGVVVCDPQWRRCKIKHPGYLALNKTRDAVLRSPRALASLVLLGRDQESKPFIPTHLHPKLDALRAGYDAFLRFTDAEYARLHSTDRKTFALAIQAEGGWMQGHMQRWSGKATSAADVVAKSQRNGEWPDAFLDFVCEQAERHGPADTGTPGA